MMNIHYHARIINLINFDKCRHSYQDINITATPDNCLSHFSSASFLKEPLFWFLSPSVTLPIMWLQIGCLIQFYLFCVWFPSESTASVTSNFLELFVNSISPPNAELGLPDITNSLKTEFILINWFLISGYGISEKVRNLETGKTISYQTIFPHHFCVWW